MIGEGTEINMNEKRGFAGLRAKKTRLAGMRTGRGRSVESVGTGRSKSEPVLTAKGYCLHFHRR